jgi:predicted amidohydrolase YtcJ
LIREAGLKEKKLLTRAEFLKLAATSLGGMILACQSSGRQDTSPRLAENLTPFPLDTQPPKTFPDGAPANLVLINGKIMTVDSQDTVAQAMAVSGTHILLVGNNEAVLAAAAPDAQVLDLAGRAVTPGLIDPHLHFRAYGLMTSYYTAYSPPEVVDIPSMQAKLHEDIHAKGLGKWINGYYIALRDKPIPTKEDLDPVSPDNPVFMMHIGGHWGTANSAAMQLAGVTPNTPSPEGGIIERVNGELTGVFYNHRAMDVLRKAAPPISDSLVRESIIDTQRLMAACGLTCFHDNNIRDVDSIRAYQDLSASGELFLRNNLYLTLEWPTDLSKIDQVEVIRNDLTRFMGYKFLIDGQGPTAYTHEPHAGSEHQMTTWDSQNFKDTVKSLHNTGLQICVHCIGDAASDLVLDAYESAQNANPRSDPRHRIEHMVLSTAAATQRMKDLGVAVSTQPAFIYLFGDGWKTLFGEARMDRIMVTREWLESGVRLAIGSDAPSTPYYHPQASLAGAMTRHTFAQTPIGPDQGLTFSEALRAHTIEAAYAGHQDSVMGSLEPGKFADFVIWPQDPSALSTRDLVLTTTVDSTFIGGKQVYPG